MIDDEELRLVKSAMMRFGGSFVMALANALSHADHINRQKIKDAWPEYWAQYFVMGTKAQEKAKAE